MNWVTEEMERRTALLLSQGLFIYLKPYGSHISLHSLSAQNFLQNAFSVQSGATPQ